MATYSKTGSLTLLALTGWLIGSGKRAFYTIGPMLFMLVTTMAALVLQVLPFLQSLGDLLARKPVKSEVIISGVCGLILLVLGSASVISAARALLAIPARRAVNVAP